MKPSFETLSQTTCRRDGTSGRIVVCCHCTCLSISVLRPLDDMSAVASKRQFARCQHADLGTIDTDGVARTFLAHVVADAPRPLTHRLTILSIVSAIADLFTQSPLWLPLARRSSFLGPHNAFACSARQSLRFLSLLASTASRCSLLVVNPTTHYEKSVASLRSVHSFLF